MGLASIFRTTPRLSTDRARSHTGDGGAVVPAYRACRGAHRVIVANRSAPFPDHTFDTVVGTLVFCTIPDPRQALCELRRICQPAGTALFFERAGSIIR